MASGTAVFVSYATADRKAALGVCTELERRGGPCWIATRDVRPGENYQEAIVQAIRTARALVLVFSASANRSDEIKKELSLASRFKVPVIAVRVADVEPSDAFAYELSTRQWIDLFADRAAALDTLAARIGELAGVPAAPMPAGTPTIGGARRLRRPLAGAAAGLIAVAAGTGWLLFHRPGPALPAAGAATLLEVRLTGFQRLTPDIPAGTATAMGDEMTAALADEGVVKVSTAAAPPPGSGPAFALGGTIRREGDRLRVVMHLDNERSGAALWSQSLEYDVAALSKMPRLAAAAAGGTLRCGLFGASNYPHTLPDGAFTDFLTECYQHYALDGQPAKGLDAARRVVAAVPDFSYGWSGLAVSAVMTMLTMPAGQGETLRREALMAVDRALALDPANSEAYAWKSLAIDSAALVERGALLAKAVTVRAMSCGCEHNIYGAFLDETGRLTDALAEYRRAVDTLSLEWDSQKNLAYALARAGQQREAMQHVDAVADLTDDPGQAELIRLAMAPIDHDYAAAIAGLGAPTLPYAPNVRAAWRMAMTALAAGSVGDRKAAVAALAALPDDEQETFFTVGFLGALGADREALALIERRAAAHEAGVRAYLFIPSMAEARADPAFAGVVERLGLIRYWRETKTRPDACSAVAPPPFCRTI